MYTQAVNQVEQSYFHISKVSKNLLRMLFPKKQLQNVFLQRGSVNQERKMQETHETGDASRVGAVGG